MVNSVKRNDPPPLPSLPDLYSDAWHPMQVNNLLKSVQILHFGHVDLVTCFQEKEVWTELPLIPCGDRCPQNISI